MRKSSIPFLLAALLLLLPALSLAQAPQVDSSDFDNPYKIHNSLYRMFQRAQKNRAVEKCLAIADSMVVSARQLGDEKAEVIAMTVPVTFAAGKKDIGETMAYGDALKERALATGYLQYYYFAYQTQVSLLLTRGEYFDAKKLLDELDAFVNERNDAYGQSACNVLIGHFYHQRFNYELAIKYYLEAARVVEERVPSQSAAGSYTHAADAAVKAEMYEEAYEYCERGLKCYCSGPTKLTLMNHRTVALFFLRRYDEFVTSYKEFVELHKEAGSSAREYLLTSNILWDIYNGNPKAALAKIDEVSSNRTFFTRLRSEVYISMGDYKSAVEQLKLVNKYQLDANNQLMDEDLAQMGAHFENMNLRAENAELELEKEQIKTRNTLVLGICAGLVLLFVFLFFFLNYIRRHRADSERVNFLVNIGHELRTPLTLILGPLNKLVNSDKVDGATKEKLKPVIIQAERMKTLTRTITSVGDLKDGKTVLSKSLVGLNDWVERNAALFQVELDSYRLDLDYVPEGRLCLVELDEDLCDIAFANMMRNVIRYSESGSTIRLGTEHRGRTARVSFEYTGLPTGEAEQEKIFSSIYHTTDVKSGNTIGIVSCKTIVERHGGTVGAADRADGKGATMWLEFPLTEK